MRIGVSRRSRRSPVSGSLAPRSFSWRVREFLGSRGHVVGMLFALVAILLYSGHQITGWLGLAAIPVMYATGYFVAARPRQKPLAPQQVSDAPALRSSLDEMLDAIHKRVAVDVYYLVRSIRDSVVFTLENSGAAAETDPDVHLVRRTATTYLPEALSTYLSLPRRYAETKRLEDGRTSHDVLMDQLSLMDEQTRRVATNLIRNNSQRLVTHGKFIDERYAPSTLAVPAIPVPDAPAAKTPATETAHIH